MKASEFCFSGVQTPCEERLIAYLDRPIWVGSCLSRQAVAFQPGNLLS